MGKWFAYCNYQLGTIDSIHLEHNPVISYLEVTNWTVESLSHVAVWEGDVNGRLHYAGKAKIIHLNIGKTS